MFVCLLCAKSALPAHDVAQLLQVFSREVPVLSVTASDVFVDAMQIDQVHVQRLLLQENTRLVNADDAKERVCSARVILTE